MPKAAVRFALIGFVAALAVWAQEIDPATLHIGTGAGTLCATGDALGCPTDPNSSLGATRISVFNEQGKKGNGNGVTGQLMSPLLLILGIPAFSSAAVAFPTISLVTEYMGAYDTGGVSPTYPTATLGGAAYGQTFNTTGPSASMSPPPSGNGPEAYSLLHLDGNGSNHWTNWFDHERLLLGLSPVRFDLFVYVINAALDSKGLFDIQFGGDGLAVGTYVIASGCAEGGTNGSGVCTPVGNVYSTPFTHSGLVGLVVPEPASILLMGTGLLAIAGVWLRRVRNARIR